MFQFAQDLLDGGVAVVILPEPVPELGNARSLEVDSEEPHRIAADEQVGTQVVVARIGKPDVFMIDNGISADQGRTALMQEIGHPRGKDFPDAVGREFPAVHKLLQAKHVDLLAVHHAGDGPGRSGHGTQPAESVYVERGDADVVRVTRVLEIGKLYHGRNIPQVEHQRDQWHQQDNPFAANRPPDQRNHVGQQHDRHEQSERRPESALPGGDGRSIPAQDGGDQKQPGEHHRNTIKKNRNGFATHFVHYLSDLRVQRYAFQNIFSIFDDQKRRKLE